MNLLICPSLQGLHSVIFFICPSLQEPHSVNLLICPSLQELRSVNLLICPSLQELHVVWIFWFVPVCKSCIVRHLERSLQCPTCQILIHPTDPFVHIRYDPCEVWCIHWLPTCTCLQAHARVHKHTHTHAVRHTHMQWHTRTHAVTHTHTHTHIHTYIHTHAHTYTLPLHYISTTFGNAV